MERADLIARADAFIWRPYLITTPASGPRCWYWHTEADGIVLVIDRNGPRTVIDDVDRLLREMFEFYEPRIGNEFRVLYRDTDGDWAEVKHMQGVPLGCTLPTDHKATMLIVAAAGMMP